mgnify:CR=1 FL=1
MKFLDMTADAKTDVKVYRSYRQPVPLTVTVTPPLSAISRGTRFLSHGHPRTSSSGRIDRWVQQRQLEGSREANSDPGSVHESIHPHRKHIRRFPEESGGNKDSRAHPPRPPTRLPARGFAQAQTDFWDPDSRGALRFISQ